MDVNFELNFEAIAKSKLKKPKHYKVIMYNDDFTTMEFVVDVLVNIFHKTVKEAESIMLEVHEKGKGIAGIYTYDIALTKVTKALECAKKEGYPFKMDVEAE